MPKKSATDFGQINEASLLVKPPDQLDKPEKELFLDIVTSNPPNHFTRSDRALLAAYCRACILQEVASSELAAAGYLPENGRASGC
jgi:phage terminase small subunit